MRAWIDRTNDGLSGIPADGISLPPKRGDFGTSRWAGSKVRLHQPRDWAEGGMTACGGTKEPCRRHRQVPMTEVKRTAMLRRGNACF
jgi:hypothetical protein